MAALPDPDADAVAHHFATAGDARAAEWLVTAGERAHRAYAWLTAADRFEAALAAMDRGDGTATERGWLLYRLAFLRRYQAPRQALQYVEEAAQLAALTTDRLLAAHAMFYTGYLHITTGRIGRGIEIAVAAVDAFETLDPSEIAPRRVPIGSLDPAAVRGSLVLWLAVAGRFAEARAMGEAFFARGVPPPGTLGSAPYADAFGGMARVSVHEGRIAEARANAARTREVLFALGHHYLVGMHFLYELWWIELVYSADNITRRLAAEAAEALDRAGGVHAGLPERYPYLPLMLLAGEWDEARRVAEATPVSPLIHESRIALGILARAQGDTSRAWSVIDECVPDGSTVVPGEAMFEITIACQRLATALCLDANDLATAKQWLDAHDRWMTWSGAVLGQSEGQALWAQYYRQSGDVEQSREHAARALAHATEPRQPLALIAAHRLVGELDTETGQYGDAETHLTESLTLADACAAPYERALTLLAMAALRAATGTADVARTLLDQMRAICEPLGAKPALERGDGLAKRLGIM
jgi:tetratricopeptide (TPR) repeat protein